MRSGRTYKHGQRTKSTPNTAPTPQPVAATATTCQQPQTPGVKLRRSIGIDKNKLNIRYKGVQETVDKYKKIYKTSGEKKYTNWNKGEKGKLFEQKDNTIEGKILTFIPHTALV